MNRILCSILFFLIFRFNIRTFFLCIWSLSMSSIIHNGKIFADLSTFIFEQKQLFLELTSCYSQLLETSIWFYVSETYQMLLFVLDPFLRFAFACKWSILPAVQVQFRTLVDDTLSRADINIPMPKQISVIFIFILYTKIYLTGSQNYIRTRRSIKVSAFYLARMTLEPTCYQRMVRIITI